MGNVKIPYLEQVKGRWYWHPGKAFRKAGFRTVALGVSQMEAAPEAIKLNAQANAVLKARQQEKAAQEAQGTPPEGKKRRQDIRDRQFAPPCVPGTAGFLIDQYLVSSKFLHDLAPKTRADYLNRLTRLKRHELEILVGRNRVRLAVRDIPLENFAPRIADCIYAELKMAGPVDAGNICRVARAVWSWGVRDGTTKWGNPWKEMGIAGAPARTQMWEKAQVGRFLWACRRHERESIMTAAFIAYYGGQRPGDSRMVLWGADHPDMVVIDQSKTKNTTGAVGLIPKNEYPGLRVALARAKRLQGGSPHPDAPICRREETGGFWGESRFIQEVRRLMTLAGLPKDLQFRDLRATATTEIENANTDGTISSSTHTGHATAAMRRRYTRKQLKQAENAAKMRQAARRQG